jgi:hypothetical protein
VGVYPGRWERQRRHGLPKQAPTTPSALRLGRCLLIYFGGAFTAMGWFLPLMEIQVKTVFDNGDRRDA